LLLLVDSIVYLQLGHVDNFASAIPFVGSDEAGIPVPGSPSAAVGNDKNQKAIHRDVVSGFGEGRACRILASEGIMWLLDMWH